MPVLPDNMPDNPYSTPAAARALSPAAKAQLEAMKKAANDLAQNMQTFVNGCAFGMGLDLAAEKWEFDGIDTFRRVPDAPAPPATPPATP